MERKEKKCNLIKNQRVITFIYELKNRNYLLLKL